MKNTTKILLGAFAVLIIVSIIFPKLVWLVIGFMLGVLLAEYDIPRKFVRCIKNLVKR